MTTAVLIVIIVACVLVLNSEWRYRTMRTREAARWQARIDLDRDRLTAERDEYLEMCDAYHDQLTGFTNLMLDEEYTVDLVLTLLDRVNDPAHCATVDEMLAQVREVREVLQAMANGSPRIRPVTP